MPTDELVPAPHAAQALLVRELPASADGSVFHQHRRSSAAYSALAANGAVVLGLPLVLALGLAGGGLWGGLGTLAVFGWLGASLINRTAALGNGALRDRLARALHPAEGDEFVGLCQAAHNTARAKLFTPRIETDDNVGFLRLTADALAVRTEEGTIVVPRADVRNVTDEPMVELPLLRWVIVEHHDGVTARRLLLTSREGLSLRAHRAATDRLRARVTAWFVDSTLAEAGLLPPA